MLFHFIHQLINYCYHVNFPKIILTTTATKKRLFCNSPKDILAKNLTTRHENKQPFFEFFSNTPKKKQRAISLTCKVLKPFLTCSRP